MKLVLKVVVGLALLLVLLGASGYLWAAGKRDAALARTWETHEVDFPVPVPIAAAEVDSLGLTAGEAEDLALERAVERGRRLMEVRYACIGCHGADLGGGTMVDVGPIATIHGPNLTLGQGGVTAGYTFADWDRAVRHGVLPDGSSSVMPSQDFQRMSDQELSDLVAYIRTFPPVDNMVEDRRFGPLGTFLMARGVFRTAASQHPDHQAPHAAEPPEEAPTVEFGRHLAGVCVGCHMEDYAGGEGGDPNWPPVANLTPHEDGLADWTLQDFRAALREGVRPDGTALLSPMNEMVGMTGRMTDTELEALWVFFRSLPPVPDPAG